MITSLLIAARGEIVCRILRAALGLVWACAAALMLAMLVHPFMATPASASPPPATACATAPDLDFEPNWADPRGQFADGKPAMASLSAHFVQAYREGCARGWFAHRPLVDRRASEQGVVFLRNAPEANVVSIYYDPDRATGRTRMILEAPFFDGGGQAIVPTIADLREAMRCATLTAAARGHLAEGACQAD